MSGTVFWAYTTISYELAKDVRRGEYHLVAAEGELFTSREAVDQHIAGLVEEERQLFVSEVREDDPQSELSLEDDPVVTAETLTWHEERIGYAEPRSVWLTTCEYTENVFVVYQMELIR